MNVVTRQRSKLIFLMVLAMLISVFSSFVPEKTHAASSHKYNSGEEIFAGIMFGQGEVGKRLTNIRSKKQIEVANSPEVKETVKKITNQMKKKNPRYFDELRMSTNSQDAVKIEKLLSKGNKVMKKAMEDLNMKTSLQQKSHSTKGLSTSLSLLMFLDNITLVVKAVGAPSNFSSIMVDVNDLNQLEKEKLISQLLG